MPAVEDVRATALRVPTDAPESDGTLAWDATVMVLVEVDAGGVTGLGWTYADAAAASLVEGKLREAVEGMDADDLGAAWSAMRAKVRNDGQQGLAACAISAVDVALWDRFARARGLALAVALGAFRDQVMVYGSGGFCSYDDARLAEQLGGWAAAGMRAVKMKVGADPDADLTRVRVAREAIGPDVALYVDANGAWEVRDAIRWVVELDRAADDIRWVEEPVSSREPESLRFVRDHLPPHVPLAAGEYLWGPEDARDLLEARAVDVLQADATRCLGLTGFRAIAAMAAAHGLALSAHCSPQLHLHASCCAERVRPLEYFHDHVRIEAIVFDGVIEPRDGVLHVDRTRAGHGLTLRPEAIERHRIEPSGR